MSKRLLLGFLLALIAPAAFAKTALDLMLEGRFSEAKAILDTSNVSPRYQLLYYAMVESDAARACSLYQVVAIRYPGTDCDTTARARLDQAQDIGFVLMPIAEWSQAPQEVRPLILRRAPSPRAETEVRPQEVTEVSTETTPVTPPVPIAVPLPSVPVPEVSVTQPVEKTVAEDVEPVVAVHDTIIPAQNAPVVVETETVDTITLEPPSIVQDVSAGDTEQPVAVHDKLIVPPAATSEPTPPAKISEPLPPVSVVEKPASEPVVETKKPEPSLLVSPTPAVTDKPEIAPTPPAAELTDRPATNGHWYVQVGAFGNYDNAHRLALRLQNAGLPVKLVPRDTAKGKLLQVRVGGYATREELTALAERLKSEFQVPTVIISD